MIDALPRRQSPRGCGPWYNAALRPTFAPRRIPFPALAVAVCLLFAAVGVAVVDDYGITRDEPQQRRIAKQNAAYIMGDGDALPQDHNRFYGIAFELPLLLVERILGLKDSRNIYLSRHLITHLFFIIGGFVCGLLAWRMFNNRWLGLLAMLLFLLHPRLYAHSFFNSKDIPFLVMFVIALYLTHRAFRRDTLGAFVLLGIVVGLAANMRPFALLLLPAVLAMRGLDFWLATGGDARRNILLTAGSFIAATLLAIYVSQPFYWENPLRFIDGLQTLSRHPTPLENLFQGRIAWSDAVPPDFIPVWFGITAPPATLLLGIAGIATVCWRGFRAPGRIWRNGELRFLFLLLGCFALPIIVAIVLQSHIYDGWRHMHFLWAPFCLLAAAALHHFPRPGRRKLNRTLRMAGYGLTAAGLGGAGYVIVSLHPHQQIYFNPLAARAAPDQLRQQYDMDYWRTAQLQGLEFLLERYPGAKLYVMNRSGASNNRRRLPAAERERIALSDKWAADFHIMSDRNIRHKAGLPGPALYQRRAYGSAYLSVVAPRLVWGAGLRPGAADYRAAYRRVTAAAGPAARSDFDVYLHDGALYYVKESCRPEDVAPRVFLHLYPVNNDDLPPYRREYGFDNRSFEFGWAGGFFDGKCITQAPLPNYPIARIGTGQRTSDGETLWRVEFPGNILQYRRAYESIRAGASSAYLEPAASGDFAVYFSENRLVYIKEQCSAADREARFYLHLIPQHTANLPEDQQSRFNNLDFWFAEKGAVLEGVCVAIAPLPDYHILSIRTGQFSGSNQLWRAELTGERLKRLATSEAIAVYSRQDPAARSEWDVYIGDGNRLVYLKESCAAANTDAKFYLHIIPQDIADLPADRREIGFENRDFRFADRGAMLEGRCAATAALPDYPVARIRTGQHIAGQGQLWQADFQPGR